MKNYGALSIIISMFVLQSALASNHKFHEEVLEFIGSQPMKTQFKLWHFAFQKEYDINSELGLQKYKTFKANMKFIKSENEGQSKYKLGLGPFSDLSFEEFEASYLTTRADKLNLKGLEEKRKLDWFDEMVDAEEKGDKKTPVFDDDDEEDDSWKISKDWEASIPAVKNQGGCGSCWAFGVIGAIESHSHINGKPITLSEQQLVDCDQVSKGCNGGFTDEALLYVKEFGLMLQSDYPYEASDRSCRYDESKVAYKQIFDYCSRGYWKCTDRRLMKFLEKGPYSSMLLAGRAMQHYRSGSISPKHCNTINHAVVVIHLNLVEGKIRIRNSWGSSWGENGYGTLTIEDHTGLRGCGLLEWAYIPDMASYTDYYKTKQH